MAAIRNDGHTKRSGSKIASKSDNFELRVKFRKGSVKFLSEFIKFSVYRNIWYNFGRSCL